MQVGKVRSCESANYVEPTSVRFKFIVLLTLCSMDALLKFIDKEHSNPQFVLTICNILLIFKRALDSLLVEDVCKFLIASLYGMREVLYKLSRNPSITISMSAIALLIHLNTRLQHEKYVLMTFFYILKIDASTKRCFVGWYTVEPIILGSLFCLPFAT